MKGVKVWLGMKSEKQLVGFQACSGGSRALVSGVGFSWHGPGCPGAHSSLMMLSEEVSLLSFYWKVEWLA